MQTSNLPLEILVARVIATGRAVADGICNSDFGGTGHDRAFLSRCLERVTGGEPFDPRDEGGFETIRKRFQREIAKETIGTQPVFHGFSDSELGDVGTVVERPVLTPRGQMLAELSDWFETFLAMRQEVFDRINAEKLIAKMMAG